MTKANMLSQMKDGETPMDFIRNNLAPDEQVNPQQIADQVQAQKNQPPPNPPADEPPAPPSAPVAEPAPDFDFDPAPDAPPAETTEEASPEPPAEDEPGEEELSTVSKENFKKLGTSFREVKNKLKTVEKEKDEIKSKLEKYETGAIVPELLQEKENEIQRLRTFEELHNLESSPGFQKLVEPLKETQGKLKTHFTSYSLTEAQADALAAKAGQLLDKPGELNQLLGEYLDPVGVMEAKELLRSAKVQTDAIEEARKQPSKALERLNEQVRIAQEAQDRQRRAAIVDSAHNAWVGALLELRAENKVLELVRRPNDPAFNAKFVDPILTQASLEYSKIVKELTKNGVKELSPEVARGLARTIMLATATSVAVETRDAAVHQSEQLRINSIRESGMNRPGLGSGRPSAIPSAPRKPGPMDPQADAEGLLNTILAKRQG